jgi:hypothetical protein
MRAERTKPAANLPATPLPVPEVHEIRAGNIYTTDSFRRVFGLRQSSLRREVREGRLKVYKRCGKYFILGDQVLAWLQGGELQRRGRDVREGAP